MIDLVFVSKVLHDQTRRRLLAKLCRERAERLETINMRERSFSRGQRRERWELWFRATATSIETNEPLTYFERLGADKPTNAKIPQPKPRE